MKSGKPLWRILYVQVLVAIVAGALLGFLAPKTGAALKPVGDAFIALIRMMIAPIIFCTVVHGIASMRDMAHVGRIGLKAIVYFEIVSTIALGFGLLAAHLFAPGQGFGLDPALLDPAKISDYVTRAHDDSVVAHLLAIIPKTFFSAFVEGDLLQVLLIAGLTGVAIAQLGERGRPMAAAIDMASGVLFRVIGMIVHLAPIGAFGAMAFTVGAFGAAALVNLLELIATFYVTSILFVVIVLGLIARAAGFSIFRFLVYIREELLIVLGTSSSETALPGLIRKLENLGASESVVGLVVPTGYSFNLDGTNIYLTLAILFLAQATGTDLTIAQEATILAIAMLTSKGASGVTGAGFVTLAATLAIVPGIPVASLAILVGIDRFMSECRALTNLVGNGVASIVVSRWEGDLDEAKLNAALKKGITRKAAEAQ